MEYLGCSAEFLQKYIESKLTDEMREIGYEIDHIKPVANFDLTIEEELKKCLHWSNLQPLTRKENRKKSCKWTKQDETEWEKMVHGRRQTEGLANPSLLKI
jgi:hypothetical protein